MTYRVHSAVGHQPWGVTSPWVWANYGQPQRKRGYVSPMVFQTESPYLRSAHLGQDVPDDLVVAQTELRRANRELKRAERMEKLAMVGVAMSAASLFLAYSFYTDRKRVAANRRRRGRRRRRTSRR